MTNQINENFAGLHPDTRLGYVYLTVPDLEEVHCVLPEFFRISGSLAGG